MVALPEPDARLLGASHHKKGRKPFFSCLAASVQGLKKGQRAFSPGHPLGSYTVANAPWIVEYTDDFEICSDKKDYWDEEW